MKGWGSSPSSNPSSNPPLPVSQAFILSGNPGRFTAFTKSGKTLMFPGKLAHKLLKTNS